MNWKDIHPGILVYHTIFVRWGAGSVEKIVSDKFVENYHNQISRRVIVKFDGRSEKVRVRASNLCKTPNRKKINEMVKYFKDRGTETIDKEDILVVVEKAEDKERYK